MTAYLKERNRKVIPRWRASHVTLMTGELSSPNAPADRLIRDDPYFESKKRDWEHEKSVPLATDLVGSAFVLGREQEAADAARFIVSNSRYASKIARELAKRVLHPNVLERSPGNSIPRPQIQDIRRKIHNSRVRLHGEPRNALLWVDLALQYTLLDEREKAKSAINIALSLAPNNRLVLRAASRLYVHLDEYPHAHAIVRDAANVRRDPWVLATEL